MHPAKFTWNKTWLAHFFFFLWPTFWSQKAIRTSWKWRSKGNTNVELSVIIIRFAFQNAVIIPRRHPEHDVHLLADIPLPSPTACPHEAYCKMYASPKVIKKGNSQTFSVVLWGLTGPWSRDALCQERGNDGLNLCHQSIVDADITPPELHPDSGSKRRSG